VKDSIHSDLKPLVSIIISVYNQLEYTKKCLLKIEKTLARKIIYEVIIIDDCSNQETVNFLKNLKKPYRVYFNDSNKGFATNNNYAASNANGDYLCFLNNDVFVQDDWLVPMIDVFKKEKNVGIVGNVQKLANSIRYDHMGIVFSPQGNPRHYGQGFLYRPFKGQVKRWSAVTAACCLIKKDLFLEVGGYDEIYVNGCEDVDLCLRISSKGYFHYIVHDSVVRHIKGASEGRKLHNRKNEQILLNRWAKRIVSNESVQDQKKHAWTYFCRLFFKPGTINLIKWINSIKILLNFKKLTNIKF